MACARKVNRLSNFDLQAYSVVTNMHEYRQCCAPFPFLTYKDIARLTLRHEHNDNRMHIYMHIYVVILRFTRTYQLTPITINTPRLPNKWHNSKSIYSAPPFCHNRQLLLKEILMIRYWMLLYMASFNKCICYFYAICSSVYFRYVIPYNMVGFFYFYFIA